MFVFFCLQMDWGNRRSILVEGKECSGSNPPFSNTLLIRKTPNEDVLCLNLHYLSEHRSFSWKHPIYAMLTRRCPLP